MSELALPLGLPTNSRVFFPQRSEPNASLKDRPTRGLTSALLQCKQFLALSLGTDDYTADTSTESAAIEWAPTTAPTSLSISRRIDASLSVRLAKDILLTQLSAHPEEPATYDTGDGSIAVEFYKNKSNLVCVFDKYGIQFLWIGTDGAPNNQVVGNDLLFEAGISQKIESILAPRPEHQR
ncbi:hypothetical protein [Achromobacter marplatensis]|uniref:hypothetical protein n=1 Tax=Achromobacter marplatensis TaxID=470868 RepID=UPI0028EE28E2|nr:hypothetical protein [Achromobacter marplatensis]